jgi:hypothetical protein
MKSGFAFGFNLFLGLLYLGTGVSMSIVQWVAGVIQCQNFNVPFVLGALIFAGAGFIVNAIRLSRHA